MIAQYDAIIFLPGNCSGGPKTPRTWSGFHVNHEFDQGNFIRAYSIKLKFFGKIQLFWEIS